MAVGDAAGEVGALDELGVVVGRVDQRDREDAHEAAVALIMFAGASGVDRRNPGSQAAQRACRGAADVEGAVAIGGVGARIGPGEGAPTLVLGIEADADERVEQGEHERAVVAPGAGRLVVRPVAAELDALDVVAELVRHADRVADEVAVDGGAERCAGHAAMMLRIDKGVGE